LKLYLIAKITDFLVIVYHSKVDSATAAKSVVFILVGFVTGNSGGIL